MTNDTANEPNALHDEIIGYLRSTRAWVREAEEMAPREAAEMLDGVIRTIGTALAHERQGERYAALSVLRKASE